MIENSMKIKNLKLKIVLLLIILIGAFFRFYKLDWGDGLYTHPDEYHIATSVSQLSFPTQMHPHFFSYGTVTIYLIYFTEQLFQFVNSHYSLFIIHNSFLIGRFYSAFFSTLTIVIIYYISRFFFSDRFSLFPTTLVALTPGLIQQAHFSTPESTLTFFLFCCLLLILLFVKTKKTYAIFLSAMFLGLALGVKISSLVLISPLLTSIIFTHFKKPLKIIKILLGVISIALLTFAIGAPFVFLDFPAFLGNVRYEGGLAIGTIPVFYTRQFINTIPVVFQLTNILPYALGPFFLFASIEGFFVFMYIFLKKRQIQICMLLLTFLSLFISNAFLFAKWTRFIAPTFPFFALFAALFVFAIARKNTFLYSLFISVVLLPTMLWTLAFFTMYTKPDVRITASDWLVAHLPPHSTVLVEGGNTVDLPLSGDYKKTSLNFYSLEDNFLERDKIINTLYTSDYFLVQSRRVFYNHQKARSQFPKTANFYDALFAGKLGFVQIKEFHQYPELSFGPASWRIEFPDEEAEETWSVFDHPVIRIFKKTTTLSLAEYEKVFEN